MRNRQVALDMGPGEGPGKPSSSTASASAQPNWSSKTIYRVTEEDFYPHEQRWRTTGMVGPSVIIVVHTWPQESPGRIIRARRATRHERRTYEEGNGQTH